MKQDRHYSKDALAFWIPWYRIHSKVFKIYKERFMFVVEYELWEEK